MPQRGGGAKLNLIKVALTSLLLRDTPFTESSIVVQRTKANLDNQGNDKVHLEIGEEIVKAVEAKGRVLARRSIAAHSEEGGEGIGMTDDAERWCPARQPVWRPGEELPTEIRYEHTPLVSASHDL